MTRVSLCYSIFCRMPYNIPWETALPQQQGRQTSRLTARASGFAGGDWMERWTGCPWVSIHGPGSCSRGWAACAVSCACSAAFFFVLVKYDMSLRFLLMLALSNDVQNVVILAVRWPLHWRQSAVSAFDSGGLCKLHFCVVLLYFLNAAAIFECQIWAPAFKNLLKTWWLCV